MQLIALVKNKHSCCLNLLSANKTNQHSSFPVTLIATTRWQYHTSCRPGCTLHHWDVASFLKVMWFTTTETVIWCYKASSFTTRTFKVFINTVQTQKTLRLRNQLFLINKNTVYILNWMSLPAASQQEQQLLFQWCLSQVCILLCISSSDSCPLCLHGAQSSLTACFGSIWKEGEVSAQQFGLHPFLSPFEKHFTRSTANTVSVLVQEPEVALQHVPPQILPG